MKGLEGRFVYVPPPPPPPVEGHGGRGSGRGVMPLSMEIDVGDLRLEGDVTGERKG